MKANFDTKQPKVKIVENDDLVYIFICLNEEMSTENQYNGEILSNFNDSDERQVSRGNWTYDYREIVCSKDEIDIDDVQLNPEKYFNWQLFKEKSIKERFEELKEVNSELIACLSELL